MEKEEIFKKTNKKKITNSFKYAFLWNYYRNKK